MARDTKRRRLDADEVLADKTRPRPTAEELAELIQRVNPTGHESSPSEEKRRYRVKAALQSLLLRRHPELVRITSEDGDVLEISLVGTGRHAAHVPLDELDEDMRAWARRSLDTADGAATTPATRAQSASHGATDPFGSAREARERGAFDDARTLFENALATASGRTSRITVVAELLGLLVDALWDDTGALELADRLRHEPDLVAHMSVRAPLALAAARSGDAGRARALLVRTTGAHAAAAWAVLGVSALAENARDAMRLAHDALVAIDPLHPTVGELRDALATIAATEAAQGEAAVAQRLGDAATDAEREVLARDHLRRWPKSTTALGVIARSEAARRAARIAAQLARADEATDDNDRLAALRSARGEGAVGLDGAIAELEHGVRARWLAHARAELADLLRGDDSERSLDAWLAADEQVREGAVPSPLVLRAAEIITTGTSRQTRDSVRAGIACARAEELAFGGDYDAAARALAIGGRSAAEMAEAIGLSRRLDDAKSTAKHAADAAAITAAEAALAGGEEERAHSLLGALAKGIGRTIAERIESARQRRMDTARFLAARGQRDLMSARVAALGLRGADDDERWRTEIETIDREMPDLFGLDAADGAVSFADAMERMTPTTERIVSPDGRELALVSSHSAYTFVRVVDVERSVVVRHALLRDPRPGHDAYITRVIFDGDRIRWGTAAGDVFAIHASLRQGLVVCPVSSIVPDHTTVEDVLPVPGAELAWLVLRSTRTHRQRASIVDLERCRVIREIDDVNEVGIAATKEGTRVTRLAPNGVTLHEPNGWGAGGFRFDDRRVALAVDSAGDRVHLLFDQHEAGAPEFRVRWSATSANDSRWCGLLGADPEAPSSVLAIDAVRSIVSFTTDDGWRLAGVEVPLGRTGDPSGEIEKIIAEWRELDPNDRTLAATRQRLRAASFALYGYAVRWERPVGRDLLLATAVDGSSPVALTFSPQPRVVGLAVDAEPDLGGADDDDFPLWNAWRLASRPELPGEPFERSLYKNREMHVRAPWAEEHLVPGYALELANALTGQVGGSSDARDLLLACATRHPTAVSVIAELAQISLRNDAFALARSWIERLLALAVPAPVATWAERARGLAAFRCGDVDAACTSWRRSLDDGDLDAAEEAALRLGLEAYAGRGESGLRRMLDAIETSDRLREAKDIAGAIAALDVSAVWVGGDVCALARLADAWLAREPSDAAERFARTRALASVVADEAPRAMKYPPRKGAWSAERMAAVVRRARAALGLGARDETPPT